MRLSVTSVLSFLCLRILQEKNANKEVEEEKAADENEQNKEDCLLHVILIHWPKSCFCGVHRLVHYGWPALE